MSVTTCCCCCLDKPGELSDSTPGSNPEKDSALDSDNSNTDLSEVNWETVPPLDYEDSTYRRFVVVVVVVVVVVIVVYNV